MKKVLAILAATVLLISLVSGVSLAEDMEGEKFVLGIWDLVEYRDADGNLIDEEVPGISVWLFNDGTGLVETEDGQYEGVIEEPDYGDMIVLNLGGDYLGFEFDADTNYLKHTDPEDESVAYYAPRVDLPAALNAQSADEFDGTWNITGYYTNNIYVDLKGETEETLTAIFGTATPTVVIDGENVNILNGALIGTATFANGELTVTGDNGTATIELVEQGISINGGNQIIYYAEK